jgi:hypothetical protein
LAPDEKPRVQGIELAWHRANDHELPGTLDPGTSLFQAEQNSVTRFLLVVMRRLPRFVILSLALERRDDWVLSARLRIAMSSSIRWRRGVMVKLLI